MPDIENLLNIETEVTQVLSDLGVNEKLAEMDDFMNQNDLKVSITNENAVVTGLVTYTCTVKDKNNNNLPGRVVEWYKGTTLLGIDATDSNGVSTFSHRVTEADIYDVHAVVRGTHAGDDIRMFVKDNTNLISHNVWSCCDYLNSTNGFNAYSGNFEISSEHSVNGEKSLCVSNNPNQSASIYTNYVISPEDIGKSFEFKAKVYNPNDSTVQMIIITSQGNLRYITIPKNDSFVEISSTSLTIPESSYLRCSFYIASSENENSMYIDEISLNIL